MLKYIVKRLFYVVLVMIGVSIAIFLIMYFAPGDPARLILGDTATEEMIAAKRIELGLDQPIYVRYWNYISGLVRGDMGISLFYLQPVSQLIITPLQNTIILTFSAMLLATIIAVPFGVIAGVKRGSAVDLGAMSFALLGQALSPVWLGIVLVLIFAVKLKWLPAFGDEEFKNIILPTITLGLPPAAVITRMVRAGMIDVLDEDYVLVARAKGTPTFLVIYKYALKNVLLPVITVIGIQVGTLLGGAIVTESVFSWNGIGRLMLNAVSRRDYPLMLGCLLVCSLLFVLINFAVDLLYFLVDPRLRVFAGGRRRKRLIESVQGKEA